PESLVKLQYTPPQDTASPGQLAPVAWFTPFHDVDRLKTVEDDFTDYDLGSGGAVPLPGTSLVVGAGKDGVLYVLDQDTAKLGQDSAKTRLKQAPIFFTYFPGFGIDASDVRNLDRFYDGKTHHLHGTPVFWKNSSGVNTLFVWGENESLRAWTIDRDGQTLFVAKGQEVASAGAAGKGGMPGGMLALSSNAAEAGSGIVWCLAPRTGDANRFVVEGILRAYDAEKLDPIPNTDGTARLKLLWDSTHIPGNIFQFSKFCPPVVADGRIIVPTYEGKVDIYGLRPIPSGRRTPTNLTRASGHRSRLRRPPT
ncbi:MAG TPA: hypothetical protein VGJ91_07895, partial [Polyangiaceae bacterium]